MKNAGLPLNPNARPTPRAEFATTAYQPIPTGGRLHLKIGYVGSCDMTVGSSQITNISGVILQASDVGTQVSVIGAGPTPPFVPSFPWAIDPSTGAGVQPPTGETPYPGTLLVAELADTSGNLRDARGFLTGSSVAANNTQPGASNLTVYREVSTTMDNPMTVQWTLTTSQRATLTATIYDPMGALNIQAGMPVLLYDDGVLAETGQYYFGGAVDSVTARNIPGKVPWVQNASGNWANPVYWDIQAVSWSHLLDKRLVNNYIPPPMINPPNADNWNPLKGPPPPPGWVQPNPDAVYGVTQPGQFVGMYLGDIINQLIFNYCDSEGLSTNLGNYYPQGSAGAAPIAFFAANPGKDTVAQAIDNACQAGYTLDTSTTPPSIRSYIWWIDPWKKVYVVQAGLGLTSPWNIDESGVYGDDASVLLSVSNAVTREKLANGVYIDSSQTIGADVTEFYQGDASKHSYSTGQPVGGVPQVAIVGPIVNQANVSKFTNPQTVGYKGAPTGTSQWYWSMGSNTIEQEVLTTLSANVTADSQNLEVIGVPNSKVVLPANYMLQIESEWMRLENATPLTATSWFVARNQGLRNIATLGHGQHNEGAAIYPAGLVGKQESFRVIYPPITKQLWYAQDNDMIGARLGIEGGTAKWETQISLGYPFADPTKQLGPALAETFVRDYGVPPETFVAETYRPGLQIGQTIYVHLLRPYIQNNYLIDQLDYTIENKRQKWTIHAIDGALIGDWRKAFIGLSDQFAPLAGAGNIMGHAQSPLGSPNWSPETGGAGEIPIPNDALGMEPSFTVSQDYVNLGGALEPQLTVTGAPPPTALITGNSPDLNLRFKIRREFVAGIAGQEAVIDPASGAGTTGVIFLGAHPSNLTPQPPPMYANQYQSRVISLMANPEGDVDANGNPTNIPIADFFIESNTQDGFFTVTPDPTPYCKTGDLFVIRTGAQPGSSQTSHAYGTLNTFVDPLWINNLNYNPDNPSGSGSGLHVNAHIGDIALVIAGHGAHQEAQQITANDETSITVSPGWATIPDYTSCVVICEAAPKVDIIPKITNATATSFTALLQFSNYVQDVVRVESYMTPGTLIEGALETVPFREVYIWGVGTRVVDAANLIQGMLITDRILIFNTADIAGAVGGGVVVPAPDTLAAAVAATDASITITGAYPLPDVGVMIWVGPIDPTGEQMLVTGVAGGNVINVVRGRSGTTASAWPAGAPVTFGGAIVFTLVPFSQVPNQHFIFWKESGDLNYVKLVPSTADSVANILPNGESFHILADDTSAYGTYEFTVPNAGA
jgi:hypothetical protein